MMRLYREWVNVAGVARDAPVEARTRAALATALSASAPGTDGYLYTWDGVSVQDVEVTAQRITITLSGPGPSDTDDETARISVQQLVWTAQGAVGQGPIPVRFAIADGSEQLFGRLPTGRDYNRPPSTDLYYEDLAPIWVNRPTRGEVVDGTDVVVSGEATTFEGAFRWELISGADGSVLDSGFGQASAGGPARGTYEIGLGDLRPGEYQIRVFELSMEGGTTVSAERTIPFTVR
ncbi:MAG: Gmad2 immunoglobulin-like domain-containing protein [Intrasporangiaceae bacterium]|nr:Gmad2 immunoglobulin-like domain-containing protein [Intrasporangiaceae bacterium]